MKVPLQAWHFDADLIHQRHHDVLGLPVVEPTQAAAERACLAMKMPLMMAVPRIRSKSFSERSGVLLPPSATLTHDRSLGNEGT